MNNPYSHPTKELAKESASRRSDFMFRLVAAGAAFFSFVFGVMGLFLVPAFRQMYGAFGADLPWGTDLVLATGSWWWLDAALVTGLWIYSRKAAKRLERRSQLMLAFAVLGVGTSLAIAVAVVALYSPLFALGTAGQ